MAKEHPTAVTIASENEVVAVRTQELMSTPRFRCYTTHDVAGVELGGALKNVLAIACGISDGLGFGSNARAALITRGKLTSSLNAFFMSIVTLIKANVHRCAGLDELCQLAGKRAN